MTNIYDVINELYNDDEGWNTVLERRFAEQFLRTEAFRGASDDELLEIWQQVMYLLLQADVPLIPMPRCRFCRYPLLRR